MKLQRLHFANHSKDPVEQELQVVLLLKLPTHDIGSRVIFG